MKGKLIVFEGISGTGKETQAKKLAAYLIGKKQKVNVVYHPSPELKKILSSWKTTRNIHADSEVYLLLADRSDRVQQAIQPSLKQGEWVISLRSSISALVYQGITQKDRMWIAQEFRRFEPEPDVLFYFDISPAVARERILSRNRKTGEPVGRFESLEELTRRRRYYSEVLRAIPHVTIDAERTFDQVFGDITSYIVRHYKL